VNDKPSVHIFELFDKDLPPRWRDMIGPARERARKKFGDQAAKENWKDWEPPERELSPVEPWRPPPH
jgi:hypothetical protein